MQGVRIFCDLDCTLIDSEQRYQDEKQIAVRFGVSPDIYEWSVGELYGRFGFAGYTFERLYGIILERVPRVPCRLAEELASLLVRNYFFPDALLFLEQFHRENLVLVTSGVPEFQLKKIETHDLGALMGIIVVSDSKAETVGEHKLDGKTHFFLDDAPREIEAVKRVHPDVVCIRVRTPASWESQKTTALADAYLPDLAVAAEYIKRRAAWA